MPNAPRRLSVIFERYDPPLYFVTFVTDRRRKLLATSEVQMAFEQFARDSMPHGVSVGRYVIMPDHVHLFVSGSSSFVLGQWIRLLKRHLSAVIELPRPHWQKGFFDHLIRCSESYSEKWDYVRSNPARAGLAVAPESWPFAGEICQLASR